MRTKTQATTLIISAVMFFMTAVSAQATTYYVSTNGNNAWVGTSWGTAKLTVDAGVALATMDGDEVILSNGAHTNVTTGGVDVDKAIWIHSVDNNPNTAEVAGASNRRIFNLNANAMVSGLTIRSGTGNTGGGGVYMTAAGIISNCVIRNCSTANNNDGGGVYMTDGLVTDSILTDNWGKRNGGGIYATGGTMRRCTINKNMAAIAGAIYHASGSVLIEDCTIIGHTTRAIYTVDANIIGCTFISNSITTGSNYESAGVMKVPSGVVDRCTFQYSDAKKFSGAVEMQGGVIRNCLIVGTDALVNGSYGAVQLDTNAVMENCTLVGNASGGIYFNGGVASNTISIFNIGTGADSNYYGTANFAYSCTLPNPTNGTGNVPADPLFVNPGSGYGLAHVLGDYTLVGKDSACFDKGFDLAWMQSPAKDLAGNARLQGKHVDIGAYEFPMSMGTLIMFR